MCHEGVHFQWNEGVQNHFSEDDISMIYIYISIRMLDENFLICALGHGASRILKKGTKNVCLYTGLEH